MWTQTLDVLIVLAITATGCWLGWQQKRRVAVHLCHPGAHRQSKAPEGLFLAWDVAQQHKGPDHLYVGHLASSQALLCLRLTHVAVFASTVAYLLLGAQPGSWWLVWFTNWTFTGYGVYALLSSALTAHHCYRQRRHSDSIGNKRDVLDLQHPVRWQTHDRAVGVLLEVLCTTSIAVSVFYWTIYGLCLQYCGSVGFDNLMEHGTSALLLLLDVGLSRAPINSFHLAVPVLYGCIYLVFHTVYALISGNWVYTVLAWNEPMSLVFYGALPLVLMLAFCVMLCVAVARERTGASLASCWRQAVAKQYQMQPYLPLSSDSAAESDGMHADSMLPGLERWVHSGSGQSSDWALSKQDSTVAIEVVHLGGIAA